MDIDNLLRAKNLAAKAGDAMLPKFNHRQEPRFNEAFSQSLGRRRLHVDDIGRTDIVTNPAARALSKVDIFDHFDPNALVIVYWAS